MYCLSVSLLLQLPRLWRKIILQKAFHLIPGLNAIHLMNLAVQETFRIETHIEILQRKTGALVALERGATIQLIQENKNA